jgi:hypothetical protein
LGAACLWLAAASCGAAEPARGAWPQLAGNPQRWGCSAEKIEPPYKVKWQSDLLSFGRWHMVYPSAQVVVAGGQAYLGDQASTLFALDAKTGEVRWQFQAGAAILHTAGVDSGKVFVAAMDGCVYAVDAATGRQAWKFTAGRRYGFSTAVLLAEGKVFVADRGGRLFALNQQDGQEAWHYDAGAPVFQSAAWDDGRVFFANEQMRLHAVSAKDGQQVWRTDRLPAFGFMDYHPVVVGGRVLVRSGAGGQTDKNFPKCFHQIDEKTGAVLPTLPQYDFGMHAIHPPPAVTLDGRLVVPWPPNAGWPPTARDYGWVGYGWALQSPDAPEKVEKLTPAGQGLGGGPAVCGRTIRALPGGRGHRGAARQSGRHQGDAPLGLTAVAYAFRSHRFLTRCGTTEPLFCKELP